MQGQFILTTSRKPYLGNPVRGGATGGCVGYDVPPTFAVCTPQGVQRNLRCTPAGYYRLQLAAKSYAIHIWLCRFSSWKFFFCTVCYNIDTENLTYNLVSYILHWWRTGKACTKVKICYLFISTCHRNITSDWRTHLFAVECRIEM